MGRFRLSDGPFWSYRKFMGRFGLGHFGSWAVLVVSPCQEYFSIDLRSIQLSPKTCTEWSLFWFDQIQYTIVGENIAQLVITLVII